MAIKVFIEREIEEGRELDIYNYLIKLRSRAMKAHGYISGETLVSYDNPRKYLVVSTWNSMEDWKRWEESDERKAIETEIGHYLKSPPKVSVYRYEIT
jgi:heme-degrading monooxygenase HmoA